MSIDEFKEICFDVYSKEKESRKIKGFPEGCDGCFNTNPEYCKENCLWPKNYWKYEEVKRFLYLARAKEGGFDLNRIESLDMLDFIKVAVIMDFIRSRNA